MSSPPRAPRTPRRSTRTTPRARDAPESSPRRPPSAQPETPSRRSTRGTPAKSTSSKLDEGTPMKWGRNRNEGAGSAQDIPATSPVHALAPTSPAAGINYLKKCYLCVQCFY